jgi:DNA helicase-2/ATP-dependent DNA helicase PcrA
MGMTLLQSLNSQQKEAVCHTEGPLLVIAGAGTGKTKVITHRISYIIKQGIEPNRIFAATFTNKAANEMKSRVGDGPIIGTFHAICADILRKYGKEINLPYFLIIDERESLNFIKSSIEELGLNQKQFQPAAIQNFIASRKTSLAADSESATQEDFFPKNLELIAKKYNETLTSRNALDFDDIIQKTILLFEQKPAILRIYQEKWPYIHIDEYQDTDPSQARLVKLLGQKYGNVCAVGDEDQSIYGFRGADFKNILNFEEHWPGAKIIALEINYRSTQKILEAANAVISKNQLRRPKNLFGRQKMGEKIDIFEAENEEKEADFAANKIKSVLRNNSLNSIAVLCRANFQFFPFEKIFQKYSLPCQSLFGQDDLLSAKKDAVRLMTVHSAKGLEFKNVFIVGLEKGLFPHFGGEKEEERRLFYVALTRAQEKIFLSWCRFRAVFGSKQINQPSPFLEDIPKKLIKP